MKNDHLFPLHVKKRKGGNCPLFVPSLVSKGIDTLVRFYFSPSSLKFINKICLAITHLFNATLQ